MTLGEYLLESTKRPWLIGTNDCTSFPADWARTWGQSDPMAEWRGCYDTDEGAAELIEQAGGLVSLFARGLGSIGAVAVEAPAAGDVGVILALGEDRQPVPVGAIWTGRRWAFRSPGGIVMASAETLAVWRRP